MDKKRLTSMERSQLLRFGVAVAEAIEEAAKR